MDTDAEKVTISEQLYYLTQAANKKVSTLYRRDIYIRLAVAPKEAREEAKILLRQIDVCHALVELEAMSGNPRGAMQYFCILNKFADTFIKKIRIFKYQAMKQEYNKEN